MNWLTSSCTLPTAEQPLRVAEFDDLFRTAVRGIDRPEPTVLLLRLDPAASDRARDLAARENECCSFFGFSFTTDGPDLVLRIEVPAAQLAVLDGLAARAAGLSV